MLRPTAGFFISSDPVLISLQLIYKLLKQKVISSMQHMHLTLQSQSPTLKPQENMNLPNSSIFQAEKDRNLALEKNEKNFFDKVQTDAHSSDEDSVVSLEQTILDQHLRVAHFEIQKMTNILFKIMSFDLLSTCKQLGPYIERPNLQEYLDQGMSLIKREEVPFLVALLDFSQNSNKFLQQVFEASSQMLVHELVFITYQTLKSFRPIHGVLFHISQIQQVARDHRFIKMICDHAELKIMSYHRVFGKQAGYHDQLSQKVSDFLQFYVLTCLLVVENYFINPYHEKMVKERKIKRERIIRRKFIKRIRKNKKIIRNICNNS